jgi:hypothetical protein
VTVDELVTVLSRERHALEHWLFRLLEARAAMADERRGFLAWAAADLETAAVAVGDAGEKRAVVAGPSSLRELVVAAHEPFATLLDEHRRELFRLASEAKAATRTTRRLATAGRAGVMENRDGGDDETHVDGLESAIALAGYDAVLHATAGIRLGGLDAFLD